MNSTLFSFPLHRAFLFFFTIAILGAVIATATAPTQHVYAQSAQRPIIIRDTEIENTLKEWSAPVIEAAQLSPESVNIILVQDNQLNAFVAGGSNIFLFTGLLQEAESPSEIIGVIAHELGHIRGGHLIRTRGAMENASYESLIGTILGIGAAVLTGEGGLASAIAAGSQSAAAGKFLAFSRVQESSADQAGLDYLERAKMSPEGMVSFMQKLEDQELLPTAQQSPYIRTHPLTRDRVSALEAGLKRSAHKNDAYPAAWKEQHQRMQAKLTGFISPERVAWEYDDRDQSIVADYARAIAAYRENSTGEAVNRIDALLGREPDNPYFHELKGQMLVDFGRVAEALPSYRQAVRQLPDAALIRTSYAHALIESAGNDERKLNEAINHLERAQKDEPRSTKIQRLLATAYGRTGREDRAKLHLAEEALLKGEMDYAARQAQAALHSLEEGSNAWLRAKDILNYVEQNAKKD